MWGSGVRHEAAEAGKKQAVQVTAMVAGRCKEVAGKEVVLGRKRAKVWGVWGVCVWAGGVGQGRVGGVGSKFQVVCSVVVVGMAR